MFHQRLFVVLFLGPIVTWVIYVGSLWYFLFGVAALTLATYEYTRIMDAVGWKTPLWLLLPTVLVQWVAGQWIEWDLTAPALALSFFACMVYGLWLYERDKSENPIIDWLACSWGILLLGWFGSHFFRLRSLDSEAAWQWTLLAFVATWSADVFAYVIGRFVAGRFIGRHQLTPRLSPNKTVEGYLAGIVLGTSLTVLLAFIIEFPFIQALLLALIITIFSVFGDLGISLFKRVSGVKDSGTIFPGHGGALDRFDNLFWTITLAYYFAILFVQ